MHLGMKSIWLLLLQIWLFHYIQSKCTYTLKHRIRIFPLLKKIALSLKFTSSENSCIKINNLVIQITLPFSQHDQITLPFRPQ